MENKNIITVIEELGEIISKYKNDIKFKDYEIKSLRKKIETIEDYISFYSDNEVSNEEYKEIISKNEKAAI